jgi:phytoene desaturase
LPVAFKLDLFKSLKAHVASFFKSDRIQKILEFPVYFLGALPAKTPALYSLMNYADLVLGTWYPMGGMYKIIEGMENVAREKGVKFEFNREVKEIVIENNKVVEVKTEAATYKCDAVVASADYHHVEQQLLPKKFRKYDDAYWDKRLMAPSSLIFYLGIDKKLEQLLHHNLFFDQSFEKFGDDIYTSPKWPSEPLFYVCCPSVTDSTVAPVGKENLFILIPLAPDLEDTEEKREICFQQVMDRLENLTGQSIREHIIYKKSFAHKDFMSRYHAFKGNAYGLANTLSQTAFLKPSMRNPKVKNLYYAGQLTVPGPGVPPSLISGKVAANELCKDIS